MTYPGGGRALKPVTLAFGQGEFIVLLGASGAGKSTLLRCLNGMVRPSAGRVVAPGLGDIAEAGGLPGPRPRTGKGFRQTHPFGRPTALANVLTGRLGYHGPMATLLPWARDEKALALVAIDRVGLIDHALKRADQLSGGQQQRVGVARALVQAPSVLLADEPVASLDPATAERLLELMHGICKRDGLTAVVSLHQLDFARKFADRIIGLAGGSLLFDGPPALVTDDVAAGLYGTPPAAAPGPHPASPASIRLPQGVPA